MTWRLNESVNWNGQEWANNSDDHYIYYYGQEFLRRNGVAFTANETNWNTVLGCILKNDKIIPIDFQGKSLKITVIQVYAPPIKVKVYEVYWFYEDLYYILDQNIKTKKICFSYRELEYKDMNKKIPGVTGKFGLGVQNEAGERLKEFWQEKTWVIADTLFKIQETILHMNITRWSVLKSEWLCSLQSKIEKLYTVGKTKTGSWLWLRSWGPYCEIQIWIEESRENH